MESLEFNESKASFLHLLFMIKPLQASFDFNLNTYFQTQLEIKVQGFTVQVKYLLWTKRGYSN